MSLCYRITKVSYGQGGVGFLFFIFESIMRESRAKPEFKISRVNINGFGGL